jgi:hypothetical protein
MLSYSLGNHQLCPGTEDINILFDSNVWRWALFERAWTCVKGLASSTITMIIIILIFSVLWLVGRDYCSIPSGHPVPG